MAQPRADQHQGRVAIGECPHHTGAPADFPVQPLGRVVGTDARPVFAGKIAVGQRLLNAILDFLGAVCSQNKKWVLHTGFILACISAIGNKNDFFFRPVHL